MNTDYSDITRLLGPPQWWDHNSVPRYVGFHPRHCGVYFKQVILLRVGCQGCEQKFQVALEIDRNHCTDTNQAPDPKALDNWIPGFDPPRHGSHGWVECTGTSMTVIPEVILEFWETCDGEDLYRRVPRMECELPF